MFEIKDKPKMVERALLVGVYERTSEREETRSLLEELEELVGTLGVPVIERELVHVRKRHPDLLVGSGKAEELNAMVKALDLDVVIFDNELTPAQQRNWEKLTGVCVIDRQEVILDIFGQRARTREARLQVDLARLEYSLPRLTRAWSHFGQQTGAVGLRGGEGESQLELDRRMIRSQIDRLKKDLVAVRQQRATQRKDRKRVPVPNAAIVGYTNAGKSSLLNSLTEADVLAEDKLFATLDTTTRRLRLPNNQILLLTDTVGFVRKLPHRLVEAFNATLEEAVLADFLIHVVDVSQSDALRFYETTCEVLNELGADGVPRLVVFNKIDKVADRADFAGLRARFAGAVFVSVKTGEGLRELEERLCDFIADRLGTLILRVPQSRGDLISSLHDEGKVLRVDYQGNDALIVASVPIRLQAKYEPYALESEVPGDGSEAGKEEAPEDTFEAVSPQHRAAG